MDQLILPDPGRPDYCARCATPTALQERGGRKRPTCPACGWVYYARPALGAAVAVELEGKLVLVQRRFEPYAGWWMLPAGFVEYGEFAEDTAAREAEEETGLRVELVAPAGSIKFKSDDEKVSVDYYILRAVEAGPEWEQHRNVDAFLVPPEQVAAHLSFGNLRRLWQEVQERVVALTTPAQTP